MMKFEYEKDSRSELVAAIHERGSLLIQVGNSVVSISGEEANIHEGESLSYWEGVGMLAKKFYKGDKITITF